MVHRRQVLHREALDISHKKKIAGMEVVASGRELHFKVRTTEDTLLEEWGFAGHAAFFEEVMGIKPVFKRRGC
jgi:exopolyphosphatase / guanosine-5'-triphosphate,3'-diphosphate pyrophosphatase